MVREGLAVAMLGCALGLGACTVGGGAGSELDAELVRDGQDGRGDAGAGDVGGEDPGQGDGGRTDGGGDAGPADTTPRDTTPRDTAPQDTAPGRDTAPGDTATGNADFDRLWPTYVDQTQEVVERLCPCFVQLGEYASVAACASDIATQVEAQTTCYRATFRANPENAVAFMTCLNGITSEALSCFDRLGQVSCMNARSCAPADAEVEACGASLTEAQAAKLDECTPDL